jgi:hypothetical protein
VCPAPSPPGGALELNDGVVPKRSADKRVPPFTWWPDKGTSEWVEYAFAGPCKISSCEVYWFDDTGSGHCRVPASWEVRYKTKDGKWERAEVTSAYGVEKDKLNRVMFEPVTTAGVRLQVELQEKFSGGILEWRVTD